MIKALQKIDWKVFGVLLGAGLLGVLAILPYMSDFLGSVDDGTVPEMSLPLLVVLALAQNAILLGAAIAVGMRLSESVGLQMPLVRGWVAGRRPPGIRTVLLPGVITGAAVGVLLVAMEAAFFLHDLPPAMLRLFDIPLWKRLLAGVVYGGITEELLMRLFLVSVVAWLLGRYWKTTRGQPAPGAFWTAIVLVAIVFGLGHLPATSVITPLNAMLVVRTLVLNGAAGAVFGYLYWRRGLEAAMLGHMSAHLVMQGPGVMLLRDMLGM